MYKSFQTFVYRSPPPEVTWLDSLRMPELDGRMWMLCDLNAPPTSPLLSLVPSHELSFRLFRIYDRKSCECRWGAEKGQGPRRVVRNPPLRAITCCASRTPKCARRGRPSGTDSSIRQLCEAALECQNGTDTNFEASLMFLTNCWANQMRLRFLFLVRTGLSALANGGRLAWSNVSCGWNIVSSKQNSQRISLGYRNPLLFNRHLQCRHVGTAPVMSGLSPPNSFVNSIVTGTLSSPLRTGCGTRQRDTVASEMDSRPRQDCHSIYLTSIWEINQTSVGASSILIKGTMFSKRPKTIDVLLAQ